jgi:hypothetical protein
MTLAAYHSYRRPTADEIWATYQHRRSAQGEDLQRIREIQAVMNNDMVVPLPELTESERPMVANLAQRGMKQMGARIASTDPVCTWPVLRPGVETSEKATRNRRLISSSWHYENDLRIHRIQRGMRLLAYGCTPVVLKPFHDPRTGQEYPKWYARHPLQTFPAEIEFNDYLPSDCIFVQRHSYAWLEKRFPDQLGRIKKPFNYDPGQDNSEMMFDVLEYCDAYYCCLILIAPDVVGDPYYGEAAYGTNAEMLGGFDNFACHPLAVVPGSVNLDKTLGEYDGIIGMYQAQAAFMAMGVIAQRRSIWAREWAVSNPNEQVDVVTIPDPASGTPGQIRGGKIERQDLDPSYRAEQLQDRIEHHIHQDAGLPAEFGGMSQSDNVRTGRRGAQVMGAAINFTIAQAQDIFAKSLRHENEVAIAIDKGYFQDYDPGTGLPTTKKIFIMTRAWQGEVSYSPAALWNNSKHLVEYPINGVDVDQLPVVGGQRIAMNTMSRYRFMQIDPFIPDADAEQQQIVREAVLVAFLSSIQALAANPEGPWQPVHIARFDQMLAKGMDPYEAMIALQAQVQEEQATVAQTPAQAQPGMSLPGQGVEQPTSIPEQGPSLQNLTALLGQLGQGGTVDRTRQRAAGA